MVKFKTDIIKKYQKTLQAGIGKNDPFSEHFLLDFKNKKIQFKSDMNEETGSLYYGELDVPFEGEHENFWVDAVTFLHICRSFSELEVEDFKFVASNSDEVFVLKRLSCDQFDEDDSHDFYDFSWEDAKQISYTTIHSLSVSNSFASIGGSGANSYFGVLGDKEIIYSAVAPRYTQTEIETGFKDMQVPAIVVKVLQGLMVSNSELRIDYIEDMMYINAGGELKILTGFRLDDVEVPYDEDFFQKKFNHPTFVKIKKEDLLSALKFLDPFLRDSSNKKVSLTAGDALVIRPEIADYKAEKYIPLFENGGLENTSVLLISDLLRDAIATIDTEEVVIRIDADNKVDSDTKSNAPICIESSDGLTKTVIPITK